MFGKSPIIWIRCLKFQLLYSNHRSILQFSSIQKRNFKTSFKNMTKQNVTDKNIVEEVPLTYKNLFKSTVFAVLFSSVSFAGVTVWQYENMRQRAQILSSSPRNWILEKLEPSKLWIHEKVKGNVKQKKGVLRQMLNSWWNSLSEGEKLFIPIAFLNALVFFAWKIPSINGVMVRYFCSNPANKSVCWPMLLSTFSHCNALHLFVNMFVLNSFITSIVSTLGKEQFVAFYCSAGVFSSLLSNICKVITCRSTMSLGASGAIMAVLGYVCSKYPETLLSFVFLPFIVFKAGVGIKALMGVDFLGVLLGWKIFDHAAHLGGALFGIFWCCWGNAIIWQNRGPILEWWHKVRNASR